MTLNAGPIPLYHQIAESLREQIRDGQLAAGAAIPTEEQLCRIFGVSRITVRRALDDLINDRLVERRRGVGTFVADGRALARSTSLVGSLYEALAYPANIRIEVRARTRGPAPHRIAECLALEPNDEVTTLHILSRIEDAPFAVTTFFLPIDIGERIETEALLSGQPVALLVERLIGEPVVRAEQTVEPEQASGETAQLLKVPPRTAILHVNRTYYSASDRPIEHASVRYHPDRYRLRVDLLAAKDS